MTTRRDFVAALALLALGRPALHALHAQPGQAGKPQSGKAPAAKPVSQAADRAITIYKDPNCGCCAEWVKHLGKAGFVTTVRDMTDMVTVKRSFGVPVALESCHTARIGRYTIEGHVPADLIVRLVAEQSPARGLAVPGMPVGSPGMEMGGQKDKYDVLAFDATGKTRVYASR
jgi:hypothetical protein